MVVNNYNEFNNEDLENLGLVNIGNSCYINSILQCLFAIVDLTAYFLSSQFINDRDRNENLDIEELLVQKYYELLVNIREYGKQNAHSPEDIKEAVSRYNEIFSGNNQHDAQEFLLAILNGFHDELKSILKGSIRNLQEIHRQQRNKEWNLPLKTIANNEWNRNIEIDNSEISGIFKFQKMNLLKCGRCKKIKLSFSYDMVLTLTIPQKNKGLTLYDCFNEYINKETLNHGNKWSCPMCKKKTVTKKQTILSKLPRVLIIHLARYKYDENNRKVKITEKIDFPLNGLDFSCYTYHSSLQSEYKYDLIAITNHFGSTEGGHYTATVRKGNTNNWNYYSDDYVEQIYSKDIEKKAAYILFYKRRE